MTPPHSDLYQMQFRRCANDLQRQGVAALTDLFHLAAARLVRYAATLTRDRHDAEDALQAAFVQIARHPNALAESRHPWPYLMRVVRNEAFRIVRSRRSASLRSTTSASAIDAEFDRQEVAEAVRAALGRLPLAQAEVVALKVWENMTFAQIGAVMGTSPHTAAARYRYALEKLAPMLRSQAEEASRVP